MIRAARLKGPGTFFLEYSIDGNAFTKFGNDYSVKTGNWTPVAGSTTNSYSFDLSAISSLNNQSTVYFRIVDDSALAIDGTTITSNAYSDDRLDNMVISATTIPEPSFVRRF